MRLSALVLTAGLVSFVATSRAATVELSNGDTLTGEIVDSTDDAVTLDHATLGRITIAKSELKEDPTAEPEPDARPGEAVAEQTAQHFGDWVDSWLFPGWDKSISAGFSGKDGNSDSLDVYGSFNTGFENDHKRWDIDASYFLGFSDGEKDQNEFKGIVLRDWLQADSPWFWFAQGTGQYDQFTDWEARAGLFTGPGYTFFDGPVHTLLGRVGVGGQYEWGDVNEFTPEAMVGVDWEWAISDHQNFTFYNYFYPALDPAFSEYRNLTGAAYEVDLAAGDGLKLKLGIENEYNSEVAPGFEENDLKYYGSLAFDF